MYFCDTILLHLPQWNCNKTPWDLSGMATPSYVRALLRIRNLDKMMAIVGTTKRDSLVL